MPDKGNLGAVVIDRAAFNQGTNAAYEPRIEESDWMSSLVARGPHAVAFRKSRRAQSADDFETWVEDGTANTLNQFDVGDVRTTQIICQRCGHSHDEGRICSECGNDLCCDTLDLCSDCLQEDAGKRAQTIAFHSTIVRRLTPVECERLQGFPDGWTQIGTPEKPTADTHRYKQLGNAVTFISPNGSRDGR